MAQKRSNIAYGFSGPLLELPPFPVTANRAPTPGDKNYALGTIWLDPEVSSVYVLVEVANNLATWELINSAGGDADFNTISVVGLSDLGDTTIQGTALINTVGVAPTTIGNAAGGVAITAGGNFNVAPGAATIIFPASTATLHVNVGKITSTGFTTAAAGATQVFTITNNKVLTTSFVSVGVANLNASGNGALISVKGVVLLNGSMAITVANNGAGALGAGDNVILAFTVNN